MTYTSDEVLKLLAIILTEVRCTLVTSKALDLDIVHLLKIRLLSLKKKKTSDLLRTRRIKDNTVCERYIIFPEEVQQILSKTGVRER